jgi:hypothetical protein
VPVQTIELKNAVFWEVVPCDSYKNRRFGGPYRLHHQGDKNTSSVLQLLITVNVLPISPILVTLMMEEILSSETWVLKEPRCVTFQKTTFFIVTAVKTSNLTYH